PRAFAHARGRDGRGPRPRGRHAPRPGAPPRHGRRAALADRPRARGRGGGRAASDPRPPRSARHPPRRRFMKIHLASFLLAVVVGAPGATVAKKLRPVGLELLTLGYRLADAAQTRVAMGREALEDLVAEAKARARGFTSVAESVAAPNGGTERAAA